MYGKGSEPMKRVTTPLCELLGITYPIIQDGMGTYNTAALAAAVSEAGGMGSASIPGMNIDPAKGADLMQQQIERIAENTSRPFAVNIPVGRISTGAMLPTSEAYLSMVIREKQAGNPAFRNLVAITTSAGFPNEYSEKIHDAGLLHIHKVGSVKHARKAVEKGVDIIIASGYEMGGHTHANPVHTMILAPQVIQAVDVPVVVSGGIADGAGLAAILAMGGAGVAMGTRFIATEENDWNDNYKRMVLHAQEGSDRVITGVYGPARFLYTRAIDELKELEDSGKYTEGELASWKDQRMQLSMETGNVEDGLVPSGQVACAIREIVKISEFVPGMAHDAASLLENAHSLVK
jgi:NAD(P)H-dependent flavin oxidoreductase YrpB (nitropropane dioxygenase family)